MYSSPDVPGMVVTHGVALGIPGLGLGRSRCSAPCCQHLALMGPLSQPSARTQDPLCAAIPLGVQLHPTPISPYLGSWWHCSMGWVTPLCPPNPVPGRSINVSPVPTLCQHPGSNGDPPVLLSYGMSGSIPPLYAHPWSIVTPLCSPMQCQHLGSNRDPCVPLSHGVSGSIPTPICPIPGAW